MSGIALQGTVGFAGRVREGLHCVDGRLVYPVGATLVVKDVESEEQVWDIYIAARVCTARASRHHRATRTQHMGHHATPHTHTHTPHSPYTHSVIVQQQ